jgi:DNA-binding transcriptional ArsR family regulator
MAPPPPALLDAARLRVLREAVGRGSVSAAAEALRFTHPAVSRQIAALEREAGAQRERVGGGQRDERLVVDEVDDGQPPAVAAVA